jgi:acyl-CoA dehydrogenase
MTPRPSTPQIKAPLALVEAAPSLAERAAAVAAIAADHAEDVDLNARFPAQAIAAAKAQGLLGAMVPVALGGEGADVRDMAEVCYRLGRACSSMAMIFAMHQIKAACLVRHHGNDPWQLAFLRRLAAEQLLLASSTTEGLGGGDVRSSAAAIRREGAAITLERAATVMSYGVQADAVVTVARRDEAAAASDQVLAVFPKENYSLDHMLDWHTLGMRGTCSAGFLLKAKGVPGMVLTEPYETIHSRTMTPYAHLLWSSVWAGISAAALERARLFLRKAARKSTPPAAGHFLTTAATHRSLREAIAAAVARYVAIMDDPQALDRMEFQTAITLLKVDVSEKALQTVMSAMRACGLSGYRTDGDASIGRYLRDVLSAPIMINNDRILANLGTSALIAETPASLGL